MEEQILEINGDADLEDAGTLGFGENRNNGERDVYPAKIKIDRAQFSIFELKRRYSRGAICLDPDFQRNYVWKTKQKSELIESVLMGIPLPLIYLAETMEGNLVIVDGRQRLTTFFDYMDNKFRLDGLKILTELNGYLFQELDDDEKMRRYAADIEDFQLVIQIIKYPTPDRVRFDIFDRVNRGGTPLNNQEMRNALYQGKSTRLLNTLSETGEFKRATGNSVSPVHMKDKYIILRAAAFYLFWEERLVKYSGEKVIYKSDIEEFLGCTMELLNRMEDREIQEIQGLFGRVMKKTRDVLGENAFRIPTDGTRRRPISMTLFESLFYFFAKVSEGECGLDPIEIRSAVEEMLKDSIFLDALTYNVDSKVQMEKRFQVVMKKYKELIHVKQDISGRL